MKNSITRRMAPILVVILGLALLGGCAPKQRIVLLPDPDGKVGKITISTKAGSTELNEANQGTKIKSADKLPSKPEKVSQEEIRKRYGQALAAQPSPSVHFILHFETGTATLTEESLALVPKILQTVADRKSVDISVVGHTDTAGKADYNAKLARERALIVAGILIDAGAEPKDLEITSHGEENLLVQTEDGVDEPKNRRVEVTVR